MKAIILATGVFLAVCLASCGGHSQANKEQINTAKQEAAEMLDRINSKDDAGQSVDADVKAAADTLTQAAEK